MARQHDPQWEIRRAGEALAQEPLRVEQHSDDSHGLLGVVATVVQAEGRGGQELQAAEPLVYAAGRLLAQQPRTSNHQDRSAEIAEQRGDENERSGGADLAPA